MPTYQEISNEIFNYFLALSYGSEHFIMHFDSAALNEVAIKLDISADNTLESIIDFYRSNYYKEIVFNDPLSCFGIIGLQLFCASSMGLNFNHNQYNPILASYIQIPNQNLQNIYDDSQDTIWQQAKCQILNIGFCSNIPIPSNGPGCFVQYPKSQVYLNQHDLNSFHSLFESKKLYKPHIQIDKSDFFDLLCRGHLINIRNNVSSRASKLILDTEINDEILKDQIYRHFLKWEGDTMDLVIKKNNSQKHFLLYFDDIYGYYIDNNENRINLSHANFNSELIVRKIITANTELIILRRDPGYGDFIQVSRAEPGDLIRVLVFNDSPFVIACLTSCEMSSSKIDSRTKEYLIEIPFDLDSGHCLFKKILRSKSESPLTWISGIKLDRNTYLKGYGPVFTINCKTLIDVNRKLYTKEIGEKLDLSDLPEGSYSVFPSGGRKFSFEISTATFERPINISVGGWHIELLSPSEDIVNISGLTFNESSSNQENFSTRNFINLCLGKKVNNLPKNQLFKALSKS